MRSLRLLEVAAEAEILRLKREAGSVARSALLMAAAGLLGLIVLSLLHAAAWLWMALQYGFLSATLFLALGDLVLVGVLYAISRRGPDRVAHQASMVRQEAVTQLRASSPVRQLLRFLPARR